MTPTPSAKENDMGRLVIVPNYVSKAINSRLDEEIAKVPDAAKDRDALYQQLLAYFDDHGEVPDFSLAATRPDGETG